LKNFFIINAGWPLIFKDLGLDVPQTLRRAGLRENLFANLPEKITLEGFFRLIEAMELELGDDELAVVLAKTLRPEVFSPPIFTAICSQNLKVAARRLSEYKPLIGSLLLQVDEDDKRFSLTVQNPPELVVPVSVYIFELVFWVFIARYCTRSEINPIWFELPELPANQALYETFLGCTISQGPNARIAFHSRDARAPFLTRNDLTWSIFETEIQRQLHELQNNAPISEQIRSVLFEAIPTGQATIEYISQRLNISSRSMQRHLREENSSFQKELTSMRLELAKQYLADAKLPLSETAFLLGYKDTSSFFRAFKTWTGKTPESFRTKIISKDK